MCGVNGMHWYALRTKHNHEKLVTEHLTAMGHNAFLPIYMRTDRWRRRQSLPLFSGYVFCQFNERCAPRIPRALGFLEVVSFGGVPCSIDTDEMSALITLTSSSLNCRPSYFTTPGCEVRIVSGPLAGVRGIYERQSGKGRLVLRISLLQLAVRAEVDQDCLEPSDSPVRMGAFEQNSEFPAQVD
jgi:transcriptional antiterminator RfaH